MQWLCSSGTCALGAFYEKQSYAAAQGLFRRYFQINHDNHVPSAQAIETLIKNVM
jgi:hypothetical protein